MNNTFINNLDDSTNRNGPFVSFSFQVWKFVLEAFPQNYKQQAQKEWKTNSNYIFCLQHYSLAMFFIMSLLMWMVGAN